MEGVNDPGGMRASDAEREAVVERLREASAEGRLTLAELTERTEAAYLAQTHGELAQITADLPGATPAPGPAPAPAARPGGARKWIVAVLGDAKRTGTWRIDDGIGTVSVMGDVTIDLRQAEVRGREVDILAACVMGDVKIIVPDGVSVELAGHAFLGDRKINVREPRPGAPVPVIRVTAHAVMGDVKLVDDEHHDTFRRAVASWWRDRDRK